MRSRHVLCVVATALAALALAPAAGATSHVYVSTWAANRLDGFRAGPAGGLTKFGDFDSNTGEPWHMAMTTLGRMTSDFIQVKAGIEEEKAKILAVFPQAPFGCS